MLLNDPATKSLGVGMTQLMQAEIMKKLGRRDAVVTATQSALAAAREALDEGHPVMHIVKAAAANNFAFGLQFDEAEKFYRDCVTIVRTHKYLPPPFLIYIMEEIAKPLLARDLPRAEAIYRDTFEMTKESLIRETKSKTSRKPDATAFAYAALAFGSMLRSCGNEKEAERVYRESVSLTRQCDSLFHAMRFTKYLGNLIQKQGEPEQAEQLYRDGLQLVDTATFGTQKVKQVGKAE